MANIGIPKADKATRIAIQKLSSRLGWGSSPTFAGLYLTGLTTNSLMYTASGGAVTSLGAATNGQIPIGATDNPPVLAGITETANQVLVANGAGTITLSTPQDIHAGASPAFAGLTISGTVPIGINMSGGTFATADIKLSNATELSNDTLKIDSTNRNLRLGTNAFGSSTVYEGDHNVGLGWHAGYNNNTDDVAVGIDGTSNVYIGVRAGAGETKLTGTVTLTQGSDSVVGAGTSFLTEVVVGDIIRFHEIQWIYEVTAVDDNTHLTIASNFTATTIVGRWAAIERGVNNGNENVAVGTLVLVMNTTGYENAAIGDNCLQWNTIGHNNTALGNDALQWNTEGNYNTALGADTLYYNTTGYGNTAIGYQALFTSIASNYNVAIGFQAGYNDSGDSNIFVGYQAGYLNDTTGAGAEGDYNIYLGFQSGYGATAAANNTGYTNIGFGSGTLYKNTSGYGNIAIGRNSMRENTSGWYSVAIGAYSLDANTTGNQNVAIGYAAGSSLISGTDNVYIGYRAGFNQTTLSDILIIDNQDRGSAAAEITDSMMYGVFNATVASQTLRVNGNIGVNSTPTIPLDVNAKSGMTSIGGIAVKLTNKTGSNSIAGQLVEADTANDDAVSLSAAGNVDTIGVFLDSGVADGSEAWVVVSGIADVVLDDNVAAVRGYWMGSGVLAGYAATSVTPPAAPTHFEEIGHCIESVAAGGPGTHILARCVLHFN